MKDITFDKQNLGSASTTTVDELVRKTVKAMFDNDTVGTIMRVTLENTEVDIKPVVEFEIRLRSINGQEINLKDIDNGS